MIDIDALARKMVNEMATQEAEFIESMLADVVEEYSVDPKDLRLEIQCQKHYKVLMKVKEFNITRNYYFGGEPLHD